MVGRIEEIVHLKELLDRTYRSLSMVKVMIRIETENAGYHDFLTVAEALNALENLITKNAERIHHSAQETIQFILQMMARFDSNKNSRQVPLKKEQKTILNLLAEISGEISNNVETCQQMEAFSSAISTEINEVVTHLQFHDNFRQRLEHISRTLEEVKSRVPEPEDDINEELTKLRPWGTTVINLQVAQLENLKKENLSVSEKLFRSFEKIVELLQNQSETADRIIPTTTSLDQHIDELDILLKNFYSHLNVYKAANQELMVSAEDLGDQVGTITEISSLIKTNELNLRLLAINSIIKATRIGRRGRSLAVLSREISAISQSVQQQISERQEMINDIHSGSEYIKSALIEKLRTSMNLVDETFDRTEKSILKLLEKDENDSRFSQVSHQLQADFSDLMEKLQFSQTINNGLEKVIEELRHASEEFERSLPKPATGSVENDFDLQELINNYTVQTERDIHEAAIKSDVQSQDASSQESNTDQSAADLGDNIELF